MKLTQDTLSKYFILSHADIDGFFKTPKEALTFVDRNSRTLLVTIGDSYTYGYNLKNRMRDVYGSVLSKNLNSDWLNLAMPSSGNFWLTKKAEELSVIIPKLEYNEIFVICTFTEVGRWFNTEFDRHINYINWFRDNIKSTNDFNKLLVMLNRECVTRIQTALSKFNNVKLKIGSNFVDQIGFDTVIADKRLLRPWYQLLSNKMFDNTYVCPTGVQSLQQAIEFISTDKHNNFKEWIIDLADLASARMEMFKDARIYQGGHPLPTGHISWANYVMDELFK